MPSRRRAIIVGAGIAGLSTAISLAQHGWHPIVLERAPTRRRGGYLIFFRGNALRAAETLGIRDSLTDRLTPDSRWWESDFIGTLRQGMRPPPSVGHNSLTMLRGDLEDALHTAAEPVAEIRYGQSPVGIDESTTGVRVTLADGQHLDGDILIGADGVHSTVRNQCFGPPSQFQQNWDHVVAAFVVKRPLTWLPKHHTVVRAEAGRSAWVTGFTPNPVTYLLYRTNQAETDLNQDPVTVLSRVFEGSGGHIPDLLDALHESDNPLFDQIRQIHMPRWHTHRTVLLGDSAWCTTLYSAYGSALALEASIALASALNENTDVPSALPRWQAAIKPTVRHHQHRALRMQRLFLPANDTARRIRSGVIRLSHLPGGSCIANMLIPQPL